MPFNFKGTSSWQAPSDGSWSFGGDYIARNYITSTRLNAKRSIRPPIPTLTPLPISSTQINRLRSEVSSAPTFVVFAMAVVQWSVLERGFTASNQRMAQAPGSLIPVIYGTLF